MLALKASCSGHQSRADICPHHKKQKQNLLHSSAQFSVLGSLRRVRGNPSPAVTAVLEIRIEMNWNGCGRRLVMERQRKFRVRNRSLAELRETNSAKIPKILQAKTAFPELCRERCVCPTCLIQTGFSASCQPVTFIPVLPIPVRCLWRCVLNQP